MTEPLSLHGVASLDHLGVIRAEGPDARRFLHAQLTHDIESLPLGRARLAAFCSAKGRLQASFLVWAAASDDVYLVCSADLLAATLKRLSMFVLRLKCTLSDASASLRVLGAIGDAASAMTGAMGPLECRVEDGTTIVRLDDAASTARALLLQPREAPLPEPAIDSQRWRWLDIVAGVPRIEAATVDRFVPQMINFEHLGGVDFKKGCYPGQEVVARSQYRGTIKRRMFRFDTEALDIAAGDEVFASDDREQPAGMVVNAARAPHGGSSALVEIKLAAIDARASIHLRSADGTLLRQVPLPYTLPVAETA